MRDVDRRVNVLGVGVHATTMPATLAALDAHLRGRKKGYVCVTGVHGVMEAQKDPCLRAIINESLLTIPDGRPTVWVGWLTGFLGMRQVTGPNMMLRFCADSVKKGYRHFFYGGAPGVADDLRNALQKRFPGLQIVGTYTPPFCPLSLEEESELEGITAKLKPDVFWVGLSTPKQEHFMAKFSDRLDTKLMIGVGAAFDIHTGRIADSPEWVKAIGLQWLHRLMQDPRRLGKRYLLNNPKFLYMITSQLLGLRRYELTGSGSAPLAV